MKPIIRSIVVALGLAFLVAGPSAFSKGHEQEKSVTASSVPAAVQQAGEAEAKGGRIVRWEKEGQNYEAVIEKNGKQWGVAIDANGKVISRHDESKEQHGKTEKH